MAVYQAVYRDRLASNPPKNNQKLIDGSYKKTKTKNNITVQSGNIAHLRYFMPDLTSNINTD